MKTAPACLAFALLALPLAACDDGGDDGGDADGSGAPDAAPTGDAGQCPDGLCLEPPASGFQIRSIGTEILPGEDVEYCEIVQLPGTPDVEYWVNGFDVAMTTGSHHLIVVAVEPDSATAGSAVVGDRVPCTGPTAYGEDVYSMTGSQHPTFSERMPPGVGQLYHGGQKVVFDYHYFNAGDTTLQARAAVNVHTVEKDAVQHIAQRFGFYNLSINTPMGESRSFKASCAVTQDLQVFRLTRHTHQWGRDFTVWYKGGPKDGEMIFTTPSYEDTDHIFAEPVLVKAGEGFEFQCDFENTSDHDLSFGLEATDEMCILFGSFYTAGGEPAQDQDCLAQ